MLTANLLSDLPDDLSQEVFELIANQGDTRIERIISTGQASPQGDWYLQQHDEWVLVLQGRATLGFEQLPEVNLACGDHLLIPAGLKHRVVFTSNTPQTIWLAVHFAKTQNDAEA